jgi:hypothetical protein
MNISYADSTISQDLDIHAKVLDDGRTDELDEASCRHRNGGTSADVKSQLQVAGILKRLVVDAFVSLKQADETVDGSALDQPPQSVENSAGTVKVSGHGLYNANQAPNLPQPKTAGIFAGEGRVIGIVIELLSRIDFSSMTCEMTRQRQETATLQANTATTLARSTGQVLDQANNKRLEEITDKLKKQQDADRQSKVSWWLSIIGKAFGAILAVVVTIASGGFAAPLAVAAAAYLTADFVMDVVDKVSVDKGGTPLSLSHWMSEGFRAAAVACGASEQDAQYIALALTITTQIALAVGSGVALHSAASKMLAGTASWTLAGLQVVPIGAGLGAGALGICTALTNKEIDDLRASLLDIQKWLVQLEAKMETYEEDYRKIVEGLQFGFQQMSKMVSGDIVNKQAMMSQMTRA